MISNVPAGFGGHRPLPAEHLRPGRHRLLREGDPEPRQRVVHQQLRPPRGRPIAIDSIYGDQTMNAITKILRVALDAEAKVGGIRYAGDDGAHEGGWYVPGQVSQREEVFYYYQGHDQGWPQDSEVSIDHVRRAVREFVTGDGARPQSFDWRDWPEGVNGARHQRQQTTITSPQITTIRSVQARQVRRSSRQEALRTGLMLGFFGVMFSLIGQPMIGVPLLAVGIAGVIATVRWGREYARRTRRHR